MPLPSSLGWGLGSLHVEKSDAKTLQTLPPGGQDKSGSEDQVPNLFCAMTCNRAHANKGSRGDLGVTTDGHRRRQLLNTLPSPGWKGLLRSALMFCF